ncbi:hypothetical protein [Dictyobacter arantiisoli]|uniref:Uncharacterized protein n=1 Tax=Dictyobacter arantiisoli TaxID=2014874 RepID=A0A5A5TAG7_9CHLR|nr:hypothetical protein [Dictyobacter arantiisoli]GCF08481.1 hypothetical protein KDI_20450 [Dictyobacter arantiisoli]
MNTTPQPPASEEPEQQPALHASEETHIQPVPNADSPENEAELQSTPAVSEEDIPTQPALSSESHEVEAPVSDVREVSATGEGETPASDGENTSTVYSDATTVEDDEDDESYQPVAAASRPGLFIHRGVLIGIASVIVVAALLVGLLFFLNRPKDPPSDWISTYTPPATTASAPVKILYYLHWTNQNGDLQGQLQLAANPNGTPQSLTAPTVGLYNKDNHIIYVVVTINGQPTTLMGKINANNDTLTLNQAGATNQSNALVFHTGSADDYKQATKKLNTPTKTK